MNDYDFILEYKNLNSISDICKRVNINYSNLINGKTSKENEKKVASIIEVELLKIVSLLKAREIERQKLNETYSEKIIKEVIKKLKENKNE